MAFRTNSNSAQKPLPSARAGMGDKASPQSHLVAQTVTLQSVAPVALHTSCEGAARLLQAFTPEHGGPPLQVGHAPAAGSGPSLQVRISQSWGHFKRGMIWLEHSLIGDVIGLISLFGGMYLLLIISWAASI